MVKVSASGQEDLEFDSRLCLGNFSGLSRTSDLTIGTPVATLPGVWHYTAGTGRPGVSILVQGEVESFGLQLLSQCNST